MQSRRREYTGVIYFKSAKLRKDVYNSKEFSGTLIKKTKCNMICFCKQFFFAIYTFINNLIEQLQTKTKKKMRKRNMRWEKMMRKKTLARIFSKTLEEIFQSHPEKRLFHFFRAVSLSLHWRERKKTNTRIPPKKSPEGERGMSKPSVSP